MCLGLWPSSVFKASNGQLSPSLITSLRHWLSCLPLPHLRHIITLGPPGDPEHTPYFKVTPLTTLIPSVTWTFLYDGTNLFTDSGDYMWISSRGHYSANDEYLSKKNENILMVHSHKLFKTTLFRIAHN